LGQRQIKQTEQGLLIDDKLTLLTLEQWMKLEKQFDMVIDI
jgi:hypothetical protein